MLDELLADSAEGGAMRSAEDIVAESRGGDRNKEYGLLNEDEIRAIQREAFDAGAEAMRDAILCQDVDATHAPEITKLEGRP